MKILSLVVALVLSQIAHATENPIDAKLSQLVERTKKSDAACKQIKKDVQKFIASPSGPTELKDPSQFEALLNLTDQYPGVPDGLREAFDTMNDALAKGESFNYGVMNKLRACYPMSLFDADGALLRATIAGKISRTSFDKIKKRILRDAKQSFTPTLLGQAIRTEVLLLLQESKLIDLGKSLDSVKQAKAKVHTTREQLKAMDQNKSSRRDKWALEFKATKDLKDQLDQVCQGL